MGHLSIASRIATVAKVLSQQEEQTIKSKSFNNVIGFYCPMAGSGVTTMVGNIAVMLAAQKKNVCVVDLNLMFPEQLRYFIDSKNEKEMRSVEEKLLRPSIHMRELVNTTKVQGVSLVSTKFSDSIIALIKIREDAVLSMFEELRGMFDYVIVDMGGSDIAYETTTVAFDMCDYIYTVTSPQLGVINSILKINNFLVEANFGTKLTRVLQNQIKDKPFKSKEFKQLGLSLLADMPYSEEIRQIGARFQFCCMSSSGSKTLSAYLSVLSILCKNIIQMGDIRNFSSEEDGSLSANRPTLDKELSKDIGNVTGDKVTEEQGTLLDELTGKTTGSMSSPSAGAGIQRGGVGVPGGMPQGRPGVPGGTPQGRPGVPGMPQQGVQRPGMPQQGSQGGLNFQKPGMPQQSVPGGVPQGRPGMPQQGIPGGMNFQKPGVPQGVQQGRPGMPQGGVPQGGQIPQQGNLRMQQGMPQGGMKVPQGGQMLQQSVPSGLRVPQGGQMPQQGQMPPKQQVPQNRPLKRKTAADLNWDDLT